MSIAFALLLDLTAKASLLCLLAMALARVARDRSPALRHDLWMAALAGCVLLPVASLALRILGPESPIAPVHQAVMAITPMLPAGTPAGTIEAIDRIWSGDGAAPQLGPVASALAALWLAGAAVAALRSLAGYRAAARVVRRAVPFAARKDSAGALVLVSNELDAPAVFGIVSPAIVLPAEAAGWSGSKLRAVLAHERAHVVRRDCAIEMLAQLACAIYWFNPLAHAAARALRTERELACDEQVLAAGLAARDYAATLVEVARHALRRPPPPMLAMARAPELERRIVLLLGPRSLRASRRGLRAAVAGLAVGSFLAFAAITAPASGVLAAGTVQPASGPYSGLDDPMSERVPLPYDQLAESVAAVPADGRERAAIAALKGELGRQPTAYGDLVRERAIWALLQVRNGQLYEPLRHRSRDPDWRVRAYAAWGLAVAGDRRATPRLALMLDDPVWRVRAMAAAALTALADPRAADALVESLADPAWQVRLAALDYFQRLGDSRYAPHLQQLLSDPHGGTRMRAEEVLANF